MSASFKRNGPSTRYGDPRGGGVCLGVKGGGGGEVREGAEAEGEGDIFHYGRD